MTDLWHPLTPAERAEAMIKARNRDAWHTGPTREVRADHTHSALRIHTIGVAAEILSRKALPGSWPVRDDAPDNGIDGEWNGYTVQCKASEHRHPSIIVVDGKPLVAEVLVCWSILWPHGGWLTGWIDASTFETFSVTMRGRPGRWLLPAMQWDPETMVAAPA